MDGACELVEGECDFGCADCTDEFGCESSLAHRLLPGSPAARLAVLFDDGAVAIGGELSHRADFDPGAALVERSNQDMTADGYVQRVGATGAFASVKLFSDARPTQLAAFADGALLTVLGTEVHVLDAAGVDRFAFRVGSGFTAVAAGSSEFLLAGELLAEADVDPGPDEQLVSQSAYVLRFRR